MYVLVDDYIIGYIRCYLTFRLYFVYIWFDLRSRQLNYLSSVICYNKCRGEQANRPYIRILLVGTQRLRPLFRSALKYAIFLTAQVYRIEESAAKI